MAHKPLVCVFGGSGFVGRHVVAALAKTGARIRVAVRNPNEAMYLLPAGGVGQIQLVAANLSNEESVASAVQGADTIINLVGILSQSGDQTFRKVQVDGAERVARLASEAGAARLIHMSALGADHESASSYASTKGEGEKAVREAFPNVTVLKPSLVFGPEDDFFNRFAWMASLSPMVLPALPLIGGGKTKFQPVYVGDVAEAVVRILDNPHWQGKTFELGGPEVFSFKELLELICETTHRHRLMVPVPFFMATVQGLFLQMLPKPLLTVDQVRLLRQDTVLSGADGVCTLEDLGISPTATEVILPTYLWLYRPHGQFDMEVA